MYESMFKKRIQAVYLMSENTADILLAYDRSRSENGLTSSWHKITTPIGNIIQIHSATAIL